MFIAALTAPLTAQPRAAGSTVSVTLWIVVGVIVLAIAAGFLARYLVKRGIRVPFLIRIINRITDRVVEKIKQPLTAAVLDEVASVLKTGHYTRNIASALEENHGEIKAMVAEKIKEDPTAGRINLIPFHDRVIDVASETALRVILEILADPRTDELVSDMLRDNINQIRQAVRAQKA